MGTAKPPAAGPAVTEPGTDAGRPAALKTTNLRVQYDAADERAALEGISFSVSRGERLALIGANGAGKSTLLLTLIGVLFPAAGEIEAGGLRVEKKTLPSLRRRAGLVLQNPDDQLFMPTVYEDVAFGPRNYGYDEEKTGALVEAVLAELGISRLKNRMSHRLSGGEKRLAALAGTLVMKPDLLLLDEPSSFLDPRSRRLLIGTLGALPQTMLIATHDLDLALDLCPRVLLLREGRLYADGAAGRILNDGPLLEECGLELPLSVRGQRRN
jgi:cobalt/nickel transport system ATP-binding protein